MIEITVQQERGKVKLLYAGSFPEAKTWARRTYPGARMWFRDSGWVQANDQNFAYHQIKAGYEYSVPAVAGPVAGRFVGVAA